MPFIDKFELVDEAENKSLVQRIQNRYSRDEWFPLGFFAKKKLARVDFDNVTVFYGGNGSGKSTLLNLIAEKLNLRRHSEAALTGAFFDYCDACGIKGAKVPGGSKMLTSEDVFKNIFSTRAANNEINEKKSELEDMFDYGANDFIYDGFENSDLISKRRVKQTYVEKNVKAKERQYSNGENALRFFKAEIQKKALYLLDEPENSMSPKFQLELKDFLEDCAKTMGCQFIIATHSPFILAINDAKIYNLDDTPVTVQKWYNLKNIKLYYDFFSKHRDLFELEAGGAGGIKKITAKRKT